MWKFNQVRINHIVLAAMTVGFGATAASFHVTAEDLAPSEKNGQHLARTLCSGCHLVDGHTSSAVPAGIPSFRGIANKPSQSGQHISDVLIRPHWPMPDIQLTRDEIRNIISYLETLRTDKASPPLLPPAQEAPKPDYPEPT